MSNKDDKQNISLENGWSTFCGRINVPAPIYHQMVFQITERCRIDDPDATLENAFGHYFRDRKLPEVGDRIEWVCTKRDNDQLFIDLAVVKQ